MGIMTHTEGDNVRKWASSKMTIHLTQIKVQTTAAQRGTLQLQEKSGFSDRLVSIFRWEFSEIFLLSATP